MWALMDKCSLCLFLRIHWSVLASRATHDRSILSATGRWCALSPSVTPRVMSTPAARVASRCGTSVTRVTRPLCPSWTALWVQWPLHTWLCNVTYWLMVTKYPCAPVTTEQRQLHSLLSATSRWADSDCGGRGEYFVDLGFGYTDSADQGWADFISTRMLRSGHQPRLQGLLFLLLRWKHSRMGSSQPDSG